jgi:hypothetical protein
MISASSGQSCCRGGAQGTVDGSIGQAARYGGGRPTLEYANFEGIILAGEYGGGTVMCIGHLRAKDARRGKSWRQPDRFHAARQELRGDCRWRTGGVRAGRAADQAAR